MLNKLYLVLNKKSIKINYILNVVRVLSGAIVGIITMPYINRVLGATSLGRVEYVNTIINYFLLFSALGIPMYGIREVARVRDNKKETAKVTLELLVILSITTVLAFAILFGVICQLNYFQSYYDIIVVMSSMIFLTNIGAEWYFQGIESQLYITIRYVGVRLLMIVIMLTFIKSSSNYLFYALCIVITTCGANVLNFFLIYKLLIKEKVKFVELNLKRHIKPILTIFIATISVNIYLQLDNLLIGSISGDKYVGYYSVANKLVRFVISFITIIGTVMLPRLSFLFNTDKVQYDQNLRKSFRFLVLLSLPFTVYFLVFAKPIIEIMAGADFEESILTMRIISPLCIIVSMAYFMGFLILYPQKKEKIYTMATIVSALFSVMVNFYSIKHFQQNGAAVIAVLAELLAIIIMFIVLQKQNILPRLFDKNLLKIACASLLMLIAALIADYNNTNVIYFMVASVIVWIVYASFLLILKEEQVMELYQKSFLFKKKKNNY